MAPPDIAMVQRSQSWDYDPELGRMLTVTIYVRNKEGRAYVATMQAQLIAKDSKKIRDSQTKDVFLKAGEGRLVDFELMGDYDAQYEPRVMITAVRPSEAPIE